jgi:hypothetical protein
VGASASIKTVSDLSKVPAERLSLILRFDEAAIERSSLAAAFLERNIH